MDSPKKPPVIYCPSHSALPLQRVDPDFSATKHIFCLECLLQDKHANSLYLSLPTLLDFIAKSAASFNNEKVKADVTEGPPNEYLEVIENREKNLEALTEWINKEKQKIDDFFEEITKGITEIINKKKEEYIKILNDQITCFDDNYSYFEKVLRRTYPNQEDIDQMFPSKEELERRLSLLTTAPELEEFIKDVKQSLIQGQKEIYILTQSDESKKMRFDGFLWALKETQNVYPILDSKESYVETVKLEIQEHLNRLLEKAFVLKNPIRDTRSKLDIKELHVPLITSEDIPIIKEWLPEKNNFSPKLLYKGSRDGMTPEAFHARCDGKGPTITFIKCQFYGSSLTSIIGGFLDQDWHHRNEFIPSDNAFVFSLTRRIKCPLLQPEFAAQGYGEFGPIFGAGHDILVAKDLSQCYVSARSYENASKLIQSENYGGGGIGRVYFTLHEIEVYILE